MAQLSFDGWPESTPKVELYYVNLPYACYGLIVGEGVIRQAPPIVKWAIGKTIEEFADWAVNSKHGTVTKIEQQRI